MIEKKLHQRWAIKKPGNLYMFDTKLSKNFKNYYPFFFRINPLTNKLIYTFSPELKYKN